MMGIFFIRKKLSERSMMQGLPGSREKIPP